MQACNLQNLPENYQMKYCTEFDREPWTCSESANRPISSLDMATTFVCGTGPQGTNSGVHTCKDVCIVHIVGKATRSLKKML